MITVLPSSLSSCNNLITISLFFLSSEPVGSSAKTTEHFFRILHCLKIRQLKKILSRLFIGVRVTLNLKVLPFFKVSFLRFSLIFLVVILLVCAFLDEVVGVFVVVLEEEIFASVTEYTFPQALQVLDFNPFSVVVGSFQLHILRNNFYLHCM